MNKEFKQAVDALKAGKPVIFPTDTVYGLGVAPRYAADLQAIFDLKQRAAGKPIAWLVGGTEDLERFGTDVSEEALELAREQWPGALTLIVKASDEVPPAYQSQAGSIGLRMPAHEVALALIREVGPLATTSANISGEAPPHRYADINARLVARVAATIQVPEEGSGTPSTVLDFTTGEMVTLRS